MIEIPKPPGEDWLEHFTYLDDGTLVHTGWYRWPASAGVAQ